METRLMPDQNTDWIAQHGTAGTDIGREHSDHYERLRLYFQGITYLEHQR